MTKQTTTPIKRILAIVLTIAISFSLFTVSISADTGEAEAEINPLGDSNGETEPRQGLLGDSNIEEVKPEEVPLGDSGQETPAAGPVKPGVYAATTADLGYYWVVHYDNSKATQISTYDFDYLLDFTVERTTDDDNPSVPRNRGWMSYIALRLSDYSFLFEQTPQVAGTEVEFTSTQFADYDTTNGVYLEIKSWNKVGPGIPASADTLSITINIDYIHSTIATHNPINPSAISGSSVYTNSNNVLNSGGITQTWVVTGPNGYAETVTGDDIDSLLIYTGDNKLTAGTYTVKLSGAGETVNGTVVPDDYIIGAETTFTVQYPTPTVTIDKPENPTEVKVETKFPDSTYTWKVYRKNDSTQTAIAGLTGSETSNNPLTFTFTHDDIKNLPADEYVVEIVENSAQGLLGTSTGEFTIINPLTSSVVNGGITTGLGTPELPVNPTSGTGTQKIPTGGSTIEWKIKDSSGNIVDIGTELTVPEEKFTALSTGDYELEFTETSHYNGMSDTKSAPFKIVDQSYEISVIFDSNGGTGTAPSQTKHLGDMIDLPSEAITKIGYKQNGWTTIKDDGTTKWDFATVLTGVPQTITLYAYWEYDPTTWGVAIIEAPDFKFKTTKISLDSRVVPLDVKGELKIIDTYPGIIQRWTLSVSASQFVSPNQKTLNKNALQYFDATENGKSIYFDSVSGEGSPLDIWTELASTTQFDYQRVFDTALKNSFGVSVLPTEGSSDEYSSKLTWTITVAP